MMRAISLICTLAVGFSLSPAAAQGLLGQEPKILAMTKSSWAYFRDFNGRQLIYFTHLESYRCGISEVRYSLNTDELDRVWMLQPCDPKAPHNITTDKPYIALPLGTAGMIAVQLTFLDGSKSPLVKIDDKNQLIR